MARWPAFRLTSRVHCLHRMAPELAVRLRIPWRIWVTASRKMGSGGRENPLPNLDQPRSARHDGLPPASPTECVAYTTSPEVRSARNGIPWRILSAGRRNEGRGVGRIHCSIPVEPGQVGMMARSTPRALGALLTPHRPRSARHVMVFRGAF